AAVHPARPPDVFITLADPREQVVFVCGRKAWIDPDLSGDRYPELLLYERSRPPDSDSQALNTIPAAPQRPYLVVELTFAFARQMQFRDRIDLLETSGQFISRGKLKEAVRTDP